MKSQAAGAIIVVLLSLALSACDNPTAAPKNRASDTTEYVNPGTLRSPSKAMKSGDWWQGGAADAETITVEAALVEASFPLMVRRNENGVPMAAAWVWRMPVTLSDSARVIGYSIRYRDRIELVAMPTDRPLDVEAMLKDESLPNVKGERFNNRRGRVGSRVAIVREPGTIKWQSGEQLHYPSMVTWQEEADESAPAPFVSYTLYGDVPVARLNALAAQLQR